jgi:hypothetical protein
MGLNAGLLGDSVDASMMPTDYLLGSTWDTADATDTFTDRLRSAASMAGCSPVYEERGGCWLVRRSTLDSATEFRKWVCA